MATVHAGMKRPYDQIRDITYPTSTPSSRDSSPLQKEAREASALAGVRSGFATPSVALAEVQRVATFDHDASIVLLGVRGVGKSSLGVLAAAAYKRRLLDTEKLFLDATGSSSSAYRKLHGAAEYHQKHGQVLKHAFKVYDKNSVIICNFSDLENNGSGIIKDFAQTHAVIHITRDATGMQSHLQVWSIQRVQQLLRATVPLLRSCTNFEFFNLTEKLVASEGQVAQNLAKSGSLFLTLKRVERDFLKLLRNILGDHNRVSSHQSAYPLSQVPVHDRVFTLAAQITVEDIIENKVDLDDLQIGADAVELLVNSSHDTAPDREGLDEDDHLDVARAFATLRRSTIVPIVLTVARQKSEASKLYHKFTDYCLRLGPEYCTADLNLDGSWLQSLIAARGRTLFVGVMAFDEAPPNRWRDPACLQAYARGDELGCSIVRVAMPAKDLEDNFMVQAFVEDAERQKLQAKITAFNTGPEGRMSVCFNKILTPVRPRAIPTRLEHSESLLSSRDVFAALFATFVHEPLHYFIYGANVSYSLSPIMHNVAYQACGMPHTYGKHSSGTLDDFRRLVREPNFGGAAVVQPYKTGVLPLLAGLSSHAKVIGSVNTILPVRELADDGKLPDRLHMLRQANKSGPVKALYGDNTDWIGIRAVLRRGLSPANSVRPQSTALVCGAGGQARSAVYACLSLGVRNIFICNRTSSHARTVAEHYNKLIDSRGISVLGADDAAHCRVRVLETFSSEWPKEHRQPSMIVSSIPTQAADGTPTNFTLPEAWLGSPTGGIAIELAYRPMLTPIVEQMRAQAHKGWILMDGFDVLPEQAFAQFELFTGRRAPRKLMRDEVLNKYREEQEHLNAIRNLDPNPSAT